MTPMGLVERRAGLQQSVVCRSGGEQDHESVVVAFSIALDVLGGHG